MNEQYLPVGCFGKLPFWTGYLEENISYPTSRAFKRWIHEGRSAASLEREDIEKAEPDETMHRRFLFGSPGSMELLAGVIRPSSDEGGRRHFPFSVFTHFPRRFYGKGYPLLPLGLESVWDALDDAWDSLAGVASQSAFEELIASTRVPGPLPVARARVAFDGARSGPVGGVFDRDDGADLGLLLANMGGFLSQLKARAPETRLELPVSNDASSACFDAAFWVDLLNRQFMWRRYEPSVFLGKSPGKKDYCVFMVFGIMDPLDYPLIMGGGGDLARVARPAHTPVAAESKSPPEPAPEMTYAELAAVRFARTG